MRIVKTGHVTYIGRENFRTAHRAFGIRQRDRLFHMYAIGKTGTGKSTLLETLIRQDIAAGCGLCLIDPHGDLISRVASAVPPSRRDDLLYVNVPDPRQPFGYNPLHKVRPDLIPLAASGIMEALKKHWADAWGVRMEHILRNAVYALLELGDATLSEVLRLLTDKTYRRTSASRLAAGPIKDFWSREFDQYSYRYRADAIAPVQSKIGALLADPRLRRILTEPLQPLRFRRLMDEKRILLVNLARGQVGEDTGALLGSLMVTTLGLAAFSRADMVEEDRVPFLLYLDELLAKPRRQPEFLRVSEGIRRRPHPVRVS